MSRGPEILGAAKRGLKLSKNRSKH